MSVLDVPQPAFMNDPEIQIVRRLRRLDSSNAKRRRSASPAGARPGQVEREFWSQAGQAGLLGVSVPAEYGGLGGDFRHDIVLVEQTIRKRHRRLRDQFAQCDRDALHSSARHRGPKTPLAAEACEWRARGRHRHEGEPGAGSDLQQAIRTTGDARRRRLSDQRQQDIHLQRANRRISLLSLQKSDPAAGAQRRCP